MDRCPETRSDKNGYFEEHSGRYRIDGERVPGAPLKSVAVGVSLRVSIKEKVPFNQRWAVFEFKKCPKMSLLGGGVCMGNAG